MNLKEFDDAKIFYCIILSNKNSKKGIYQFRKHNTLSNHDCYYYYNGANIFQIDSLNIKKYRDSLLKENFPLIEINKSINRLVHILFLFLLS